MKGLEDPVTKNAWDRKNEELHNALQKLSEDLYKKKTHFIMELIQNAEDNSYNSDVLPFIKFLLDTDILTVQNNENGFNQKDVENICSVGKTKKSKILGYIGEKGIGFKSVFKISDSPKIISNGFQFEFRRSEKNNLGYIVPYWLPTIPETADPRITNIILPLREDALERLNLFDDIDSTLILFLNKICHLEIQDNVQGTCKLISKTEIDGLITIEYLDQRQYWRVIRQTFEVPTKTSEREPGRAEIAETDIILAFPVNETGAPESIKEIEKPDIFSFLPVKKCGFKFIIQADFLLTSNREDILQDSPWNQFIVGKISEVFIRAIEEFREDEELKTKFFRYLSLSEEITDDFFHPIIDGIFESLRETECILTESGSWKKPSEVYYPTLDFQSLISNEELLHHFGKEYISESVFLNKKFRDILGLEDFTSKHVVKCLIQPEWVRNHPNEWLIQLYRFCADQINDAKPGNLCLEDIEQLPIIKLENEEFTSAGEEKVFYYLEKTGKRYGFESDLEGTIHVFNTELRKQIRGQENKKDFEDFLRKLNITDPEPKFIIEEYILPLYQRGGWEDKSQEILQGHIHFIKDNFKKLEDSEEIIDPLRDIFLRIIGKGGDAEYKHPHDIFLDKKYGSDYHLLAVMKAAGEPFFHENSLHQCYIEKDNANIDAVIQKTRADSKPKKGKRRIKDVQIKSKIEKLEQKKENIVDEWKNFFLALGVHEGIKIIRDPDTERLRTGSIWADSTITNKSIQATDLEQTIWKDSGWEKTQSHYYIEDDWNSPDLGRIFSCFENSPLNQKIKISTMLFRLLRDKWGVYRRYSECKYYHRDFNQRGWSSDKTQSTFLFNLRTYPWIETKTGEFAPPKDVFLDEKELKTKLGNSVPYIKQSIDSIQDSVFIQDMGMRTKLSAKEIIDIISKNIQSRSRNIDEFRSYYGLLQEVCLDADNVDEADVVQNAFAEQPLIFVPETKQEYYKADEVFWEAFNYKLDRELPSLNRSYPEQQTLFIDNIKVKKIPEPVDLIAVLERISEQEEIGEEDEQNIVTIYKELNTILKRNPEHSEETWWKGFVNKFLILVDKRAFWKNDEDIFVNDDPVLYDLFNDFEDIAFLGVDAAELRDLEHFIKYTGIQELSKSIRSVLVDGGLTPCEDTGLSQHIQQLIPYILRNLYHRHPEDYDRLKKTQKLDYLKDLSCIRLSPIKVEYTLNDHSVEDYREVFLDRNILYLNTTDQSRIAIELAKFFEDINQFDFISVLFNLPDHTSIEKHLLIKNIPPLPPDEVEWYNSPFQTVEIQNIPVRIPKPELSSGDATGNYVSSPPKTDRHPVAETSSPSVGDLEKAGEAASAPGVDGIGVIDAADLKLAGGVGKQQNATTVSRESENNVDSGKEDADELLKIDPDSVDLIFAPFTPRHRKDTGIGANKPISVGKSDKEWNRGETFGKQHLRDIGRWGEKAVYQNLKAEMQEMYPDASVSDTEEGFIVRHNTKYIARVIWHNRIQEDRDRGQGHDIKIIEENRVCYIEVKTSTSPRKSFIVTRNEWDLAKESGDNYYIYHVYYSPVDDSVICERIQNPIERWKRGELDARIIEIQL